MSALWKWTISLAGTAVVGRHLISPVRTSRSMKSDKTDRVALRNAVVLRHLN